MSNGIAASSGRWRRLALAWTIVCAAGSLQGCQRYERAPLDLASHGRAYEMRLEGAERIAEFLERVEELGAIPPEHFDVDDGISLAEAEAIALVFNPDLRLARLRAGVALAEFEHAGLWQDPVFGFDGADILSNASPFEYGLRLSLTIPISGRLGVERDRAGAAYEAELRRIADAEWEMRASVRSAWAAWTIAGERVTLLQQTIGELNRISMVTDELESAGELMRIDSRLVRLELVQRRAALVDAEYHETRARQELLMLLGLPLEARATLLPSVPINAPLDNKHEAQQHDRLIASNTALAVWRAEYQVAEESLRLAVREQFPDITIGGGYGSEGDDRLLLGFSMPIPVLNANRGVIAKARAERDLARAGAESAFEHLAARLGTATSAYHAAHMQRILHETVVLPLVAEQLDDLDRLARLGEWNALVLIDAIGRELEAKTQLLELRLAEARAAITITQLLGPEQVSATDLNEGDAQ